MAGQVVVARAEDRRIASIAQPGPRGADPNRTAASLIPRLAQLSLQIRTHRASRSDARALEAEVCPAWNLPPYNPSYGNMGGRRYSARRAA